jgi:hypothetical protein
MLTVTYAECHTKAPYAECHYAECRYAECHGAAVNRQGQTLKLIRQISEMIFYSKTTIVNLIGAS